MALLHGKQIAGTSVSLGKLDGTGIVTFTAATMSFASGTVLTTEDSNINQGIDVVNKNYVDAVASGLDPKASSRVIYNGDITTISGYTYSNGNSGVGATLTFNSGSFSTIDGVGLTAGNRVIINSSTELYINGIYVYGATDSFFTRATDFDGSPAQEVDGGEFSFVTEGTSYADTGWVVSQPNTTALIGTTSIVWVQFSAAGVILAGDGLIQVGSDFNVNTGTGLTISSDTVAIANTDVSAGNYGTAGSVATFTVNAQGQLVGATSVSIDINSTQINDFSTAVDTVIFDSDNFVDSDTIDFTVLGATGLSADVKIDGVTASGLSVSSNGISVNVDGVTILVNNNGELEVDSSAIVPDVDNGLSIDGVTSNIVLGGTLSQITTINAAGYDFTIGGADIIQFTGSVFDVEGYGFISLDAGTGSVQVLADDTITISASGSVDLVSNGSLDFSFVTGNVTDNSGNGLGLVYTSDYSLTFATNSLVSKLYVDNAVSNSTYFAGDGLQLNGLTFSINPNSAGSGLTYSSGVFNVNLGDGLVFSGDDITLNSTIAGTGLDYNAGVLTVNTTEITGALAGNGLTANGSALDVNVNADSLEIISDVIRLKDTITGDRTFQDSVTIQGNLIVEGTQSIINTENIFIEDNIITLNATYSGPYNVVDAGIEANLGGGTFAALIWDSSESLWAAGFSGSTSTIITEAGTGLTKSGNTLSIDTAGFASELAGAGLTSSAGVINVGAGTGITVSADTVSVDFTSVSTTLAGDGLSANGGTLSVNVDNGLSIVSDIVVLGGTLSQNTTIDGNGTYNLSFNGIPNFNIAGSPGSLLSVNSGEISLTSSDNTTLSSSTFSLSFNSGLITDNSGGEGLVYTSDYTGTFVTNSLVTKQYVDEAVQLINDDFITAIEVGAGLTVSSATAGTASISILDTTAGNGLTFSSGVYDINTSNGITILNDSVQIADTIAGEGLTFSSGVVNMVWGGTSTGLTFSNDAISANVDGTTIIVNGSGQLQVVAGSAQPVYATFSGITATNTDPFVTLPSTPNNYSRIEVYVNGLKVTAGGNVGNLPAYGGQSVQFVGTASTWESTSYNIESTDLIEVVYEA
jgi:hypothetical protein